MSKARDLKVLVLDDDPSRLMMGDPQFFGGFTNHRCLKTWAEVQRAITESSADPAAPDVILSDVAFDKDDDLRGRGGGLVPVGPILALPFLVGRMVSTIQFYSRHLGDPALLDDWGFVAALGLIAAKKEEVVFRSEGLAAGKLAKGTPTVESYVADLRNRSLDGPRPAFKAAMADYRTTLKDRVVEGKLHIGNRDELLGWVEVLRADGGLASWSDAPGIQILGPAIADEIRQGAVWQDLVTKDPIAKPAKARLIEYWSSVLSHADGPVEVALTVMAENAKALYGLDADPVRVDHKILDRLRTRGIGMSAEDKRSTLALCVVFAQMYSFQEDGGLVLARVHGLLGIDRKIYESFFGARSKRGAPERVLGRTLRIAPLNRFSGDKLYLERHPSTWKLSDEERAGLRKFVAKLAGDQGWRMPDGI